jgi:hypothetical protein
MRRDGARRRVQVAPTLDSRTLDPVGYRVSIRLSDQARRGVDQLVHDAGVSLTAIIEAFGLLYAEDRRTVSEDVLARARQVDAERRDRR